MIHLKKAILGDCESVYHLRNHPQVRRHFFDPRKIAYKQHQQWFENSLQNENRIILLAEDAGTIIGVIRFDILENDPKTAEIDIYIDPEKQSRGFGNMILTAGERWIKRNTSIKFLIARVKRENVSSVKMFKHCEFEIEYLFFKKNILNSQEFFDEEER